VQVELPDFICCGMPASGYGDTESMLAMAKKNLEAMRNLNVDAIITTCASCGSMLKKYASIFKDDAALAAEAKAFAAKVKDLSEFLVSIGLNTEMGTVKQKVTYHDPCHLRRLLGVHAEPRAALRALAGEGFREAPRPDSCCGFGGTFALDNIAASSEMLGRRAGELASTGASVVATACPGCMAWIANGIDRVGGTQRTVHLIELLAAGLRQGK